MKILVVDDNKATLKIANAIIENHIENTGVILSSNPDRVMPLLEKDAVDIVILDIIMPEMDGIRLLKQIRRIDDFKDIQVLMLTSVTDKDSFRQCFEAGANDYITKPIDVVEFTARVRMAIQGRKNALKLREAQSQLLQQEKLASLGEIAAGVAHEINNPIGFVGSNLDTMERYIVKLSSQIAAYQKLLKLIPNEAVSRQDLIQEARCVEELERKQKINFLLEDMDPLIRESKDGVDRVAKIVKSLRNFARVGNENELALHDLSQIVEESLLIIWNEIKYTAKLEKKLDPAPCVTCNKNEIAQVLINIFSNASQAIKSQNRGSMGVILVEVYQENGYAVCKITDDGPGIKPEHLGRVFDPFFTTKDVGVGTGLGLSIAYGIVKKHGGEFLVESEWGKGAAFTLKLPHEPV